MSGATAVTWRRLGVSAALAGAGHQASATTKFTIRSGITITRRIVAAFEQFRDPLVLAGRRLQRVLIGAGRCARSRRAPCR